jgi:hypothetical protein
MNKVVRIFLHMTRVGQHNANMLVQRCADEQNCIGPNIIFKHWTNVTDNSDSTLDQCKLAIWVLEKLFKIFFFLKFVEGFFFYHTFTDFSLYKSDSTKQANFP